MSTKRTTITIPATLYAEAERLMAEEHFTDFSGFVQQLIRSEKERRMNRALHLAERAAELATSAQPPNEPVRYTKHPPPKQKAG